MKKIIASPPRFLINYGVTIYIIMSAETNIKKSTDQLEAIGVSVNAVLIEKIVKRLGIANQSVDASHVAATDPSEVERLKKNFVIKKLEQEDNADTDKAIADALAKMSQHRMKQRGAVYYLLTVHYGKESVYL